MATVKGLYTPKYPEKYLGDPRKIRFMSSWELRFMQVCDLNPNILNWGSEEFRIKYWNPIKKKRVTTSQTSSSSIRTEQVN